MNEKKRKIALDFLTGLAGKQYATDAVISSPQEPPRFESSPKAHVYPFQSDSDSAPLEIGNRTPKDPPAETELDASGNTPTPQLPPDSATIQRRKQAEHFLNALIVGGAEGTPGLVRDSTADGSVGTARPTTTQFSSHLSEDSLVGRVMSEVNSVSEDKLQQPLPQQHPADILNWSMNDNFVSEDSVSKAQHVHLAPNNKQSKNVIFARLDTHREATFDIISRDARVYFTTPLGSPVVCFSVLRFYDEKRRKRNFPQNYMDKLVSVDSLKKRKFAESYVHFLQPANTGSYDPNLLDDPELKTGKHKTVITLPSYIASIIQYTKPAELKQELNDQFRAAHEDLCETGLTLSKIRNLKTNLLEVGLVTGLELATIAKAYTYFEKLVLKNFVTKDNRKLIAGACLLLAVKINDHKETKCSTILTELEKQIYVSPKDVRDHEFPVFVALEFNLHIPREEYMPHMERIISLLDYYNVQEYLSGKEPPPPSRLLQYI